MKKYMAIMILLIGMLMMAGCDSSQEEPSALDRLYEANQMEVIFEQYPVLNCTTEVWEIVDGQEQWKQMKAERFNAKDGTILYLGELTNSQGEIEFAQGAYIDQNTPGAYYTAVPSTNSFGMTIYPKDEYFARICDFWLPRGEGMTETLVNVEENETHNTKIITTEAVLEGDNLRIEVLYFVDGSNGLISGIEQNVYQLDSDTKIMVCRSNVWYEGEREISYQAPRGILQAQDSCNLTVIINKGTDTEETQQFQIAKNTVVTFAAQYAYELYADEAYESPITTIDTTKDATTVYVKEVK